MGARCANEPGAAVAALDLLTTTFIRLGGRSHLALVGEVLAEATVVVAVPPAVEFPFEVIIARRAFGITLSPFH